MARAFPCKGCGANVEFSPGAQTLKCPYCGREHQIPQSPEQVRELDFKEALAEPRGVEVVERTVVSCGGCGAEVVLAEGVTADRCSFCDNPIVAQAQSRQLIQPKAVLPFKVTSDQAKSAYSRWMKSLWFAPNDLTDRASGDSMDGVYIPFWTFDSETESYYTGQRGEHYYVEERYNALVDGEQVTKSRRVRRTRWHSASGVVWRHFDDVLISGSVALPEKLVNEASPWDLDALVPFDDRYLAGFRAECYQIDLEGAFGRAKRLMDAAIRRSCARDIGGDEQRVHSVNTQHYGVTFKHVLLPLWISAYRYGGKTYRFVINARTGEVQGMRPYSWGKIALAVAMTLAVLLIFYYLWGR